LAGFGAKTRTELGTLPYKERGLEPVGPTEDTLYSLPVALGTP
jgi:hypothetical protein